MTRSRLRMIQTALLGSLLFVMVAAQASAFDGNRRGFTVGFGFGAGLESYRQTIERRGQATAENGQTTTTEWEDEFAVQTDFKLGFAPSDRVQIYWMSRVAWFTQRPSSNDETEVIANGWGGLGVSYYFRRTSPSLYLTGGAGYCSWATLTEDTDTFMSFGYIGGIGYEFARHWSVEATLGVGHPDREEGDVKLTADLIALRLTVGYMCY